MAKSKATPLARSGGSEHVYFASASALLTCHLILVESPLSNISERPLTGLTIQIDRDLCVGFGDCIDVTPDVFEFDEEGIAIFKEDNPEVDRDTLLESCLSCPVDALLALDGGGKQLAP